MLLSVSFVLAHALRRLLRSLAMPGFRSQLQGAFDGREVAQTAETLKLVATI